MVVNVRLPGLRSPGSLLAGAYGFLAVAEEAVAGLPQMTTKLIGGGFVLAVAASFIQGRRPERPPLRTLVLPVALLAAWCALSITWTVDVEATRVRALHVAFEALLIAALALDPHGKRTLRYLAVGLGAGAVLLSLGFFASLGLAQGARLDSFGVHANLQAREVAFGLLAAGLIAAGPRRRLALTAAALGGVALGLSFSSGAWLALAAAAAILALDRQHRALVAALLTGLVAGALLLSVAAQSEGSRLRTPVAGMQGSTVEGVGSGRLVLWRHALQLSAEHPLLGVGAGAFPTAVEKVRVRYQRAGGDRTKPARRSHSVYLDLLAETGPLSVLLFVLPLAIALGSGWRERDRVVLALVAFILVSAATDSLLHQRSLWLAVAVACLASERAR